ncbi:hypothetical protein J2T17_007478 [Paenibacillus mucilaginosus]|uniref:hypothetical protein n=1 Tax=Paenibacillus mucilaginosus TaxID=61624 RepID=UPI003D220598
MEKLTEFLWCLVIGYSALLIFTEWRWSRRKNLDPNYHVRKRDRLLLPAVLIIVSLFTGLSYVKEEKEITFNGNLISGAGRRDESCIDGMTYPVAVKTRACT